MGLKEVLVWALIGAGVALLLSSGGVEDRKPFKQKAIETMQQDMVEKFSPAIGVRTAMDLAHSDFMTSMFRFAVSKAMASTPEHLQIAYDGPVEVEIAKEWGDWWKTEGSNIINQGILEYTDENQTRFLAVFRWYGLDAKPMLEVASGLKV